MCAFPYWHCARFCRSVTFSATLNSPQWGWLAHGNLSFILEGVAFLFGGKGLTPAVSRQVHCLPCNTPVDTGVLLKHMSGKMALSLKNVLLVGQHEWRYLCHFSMVWSRSHWDSWISYCVHQALNCNGQTTSKIGTSLQKQSYWGSNFMIHCMQRKEITSQVSPIILFVDVPIGQTMFTLVWPINDENNTELYT